MNLHETPPPAHGAALDGVRLHPLALCESESIGGGTQLWAHVHVMAGAVIGRDCSLGDSAFVESGARIGDRVTIKNQVMIWDGVTIENDAFIGPGVIFTNDAAPRSRRMPHARARYQSPERWRVETIVRQGASIAAGAIILPGREIGRYALVGAGSVVTRDVLPHQVVVGNPARPLGWVCVCGLRLDDEQHCVICNVSYDFPAEQSSSVAEFVRIPNAPNSHKFGYEPDPNSGEFGYQPVIHRAA